MRDGMVEGLAHLAQRLLDEGRLDGSFVGKVLVDRRRSHAEVISEAPHREGGGAVGFEDAPGDAHQLRGAGRALSAKRRTAHPCAGRSSRTNTGCMALM